MTDAAALCNFYQINWLKNLTGYVIGIYIIFVTLSRDKILVKMRF